MRRAVSLVVMLLSSLTAAAAADGAGILARASAKLRSMGSYEVSFSVAAGEFRASGRYVVSGRAYWLTLGDAEVFCDGSLRYEVNRMQEEITVDTVDPDERNILNNPVSGLDFLGEEYDSEILSSDGASTVVRLRRRDNSDGTVIDVTIGGATQLPVRIVYRLGSDDIAVELPDIRQSSVELPKFDPAAYPGYEIIDFR